MITIDYTSFISYCKPNLEDLTVHYTITHLIIPVYKKSIKISFNNLIDSLVACK